MANKTNRKSATSKGKQLWVCPTSKGKQLWVCPTSKGKQLWVCPTSKGKQLWVCPEFISLTKYEVCSPNSHTDHHHWNRSLYRFIELKTFNWRRSIRDSEDLTLPSAPRDRLMNLIWLAIITIVLIRRQILSVVTWYNVNLLLSNRALSTKCKKWK